MIAPGPASKKLSTLWILAITLGLASSARAESSEPARCGLTIGGAAGLGYWMGAAAAPADTPGLALRARVGGYPWPDVAFLFELEEHNPDGRANLYMGAAVRRHHSQHGWFRLGLGKLWREGPGHNDTRLNNVTAVSVGLGVDAFVRMSRVVSFELATLIAFDAYTNGLVGLTLVAGFDYTHALSRVASVRRKTGMVAVDAGLALVRRPWQSRLGGASVLRITIGHQFARRFDALIVGERLHWKNTDLDADLNLLTALAGVRMRVIAGLGVQGELGATRLRYDNLGATAGGDGWAVRLGAGYEQPLADGRLALRVSATWGTSRMDAGVHADHVSILAGVGW